MCDQECDARWLLPAPQTVRKIVILEQVQDPATTGGQLVPDGGWLGITNAFNVGMLFRTFPVKGVDYYVDKKWFQSGPLSDQHIESGVYTVSEAPKGSAACADKVHEAEDPVDLPGYGLRRNGSTTCLVWSSGGPLDLTKYDLVIVNRYIDEAASQAGYTRYVQEIRGGDGKVYARAVRYNINWGSGGAVKAEKTVYDLLRDTYKKTAQ